MSQELFGQPAMQSIWKARVTNLAGILIVVAIVSIGVSYFYSHYVALLLGVFLLVSGITHLSLATGLITMFGVRVIDFVYVFCSCLAAFLAFQSQHDRESYLYRLGESNLAARARLLRVEPDPGKLAVFIESGARPYCTDQFTEYLPIDKAFCTWTETLRGTLASGVAEAERPKLATDAEAYASARSWNSLLFCQQNFPSNSANRDRVAEPPIVVAQKGILCGRSGFTNSVLDVLDVMAKQYLLKVTPQPAVEPDSLAFGVLKTIVWPLLFAVALALRLTKATADMTGWAA